jgi:hypothetical protein
MTQKQIDEALEMGEAKYCGELSRAIKNCVTLAAVYRAELKANEEEVNYSLMLERQYAEMLKQVSRADWDGWYDMLARHEAERKEAKKIEIDAKMDALGKSKRWDLKTDSDLL